ncbi:MAG: hypothetical protein KF763_05815 [Cyclobacteriaceae bacterium]|jgi:hypothetical protein|nr:hypothetical protein [Cyclobacteriaceae bacterium]
MSTNQIQKKLQDVIETGDTRLLKMLYAVAKEYNDENFALPGKAMSVKTLKTRVNSAKRRIQSGQFTTQAELDKEMKSW